MVHNDLLLETPVVESKGVAAWVLVSWRAWTQAQHLGGSFCTQLNLTSAGRTKKVYSPHQRKIYPIFASRAFASDASANEAFQLERPAVRGCCLKAAGPGLHLEHENAMHCHTSNA